MLRMFIIILMVISCGLAAKDTTCQKGGEYCVNHWDCCSNTCLSYLYQCSHITSTDILPVAAEKAPILSSSSFAAPASASATIGQSITPETVSYESLLEMLFGSLKSQPTAVGRELNSISPRLGDVPDVEQSKKVEEVISTTTAGLQCSEIGSKCYTNEECCSNRCHGFLHQCVT